MAEALRTGPPEGRVTLRNVSWETYERLLEEDPGRTAPRFFYDRGVLEIVSPSAMHEGLSRLVATLIGELTVELEIDVFDVGSTTFRRSDLDAGDPPPDLVVEVDITSPSTSKLAIYARLGVPEVWRHELGERLTILGLWRDTGTDEGYYAEIPESAFLGPARVVGEELTRLVEEGLVSGRPAWVRKVREWARGLR